MGSLEEAPQFIGAACRQLNGPIADNTEQHAEAQSE